MSRKKQEDEHEHDTEEENVIYLADPNVGVKYSWNDKLRSWLQIFFKTKTFHLLVVVLVLLDLFIVIFDLVVALSYCGDDHPPHKLEEVVHVFHYISIAILCVFVLENLLQFYAFGPTFFTQSILHCIDFVVVVISLVLDIVIANESIGEVASVLVVVRLWRLARIVHATEHITAFEKEHEHHGAHETVAHLEQELETQKKKVHQLQRRLHQHKEREHDIAHKYMESGNGQV